MSRLCTAVLAAAALCSIASVGSAQSGGAALGADEPTNWTLDAPVRAAHPKKKGASASKGAAPAAQPTEEAARLARAREKFFAKPPDEVHSEDHNYTGLNNTNGLYDQGSGGFKPGAQFKF